MAQPEFFLDRSLGKRVASELILRGWVVHRIVDYFPDDAQQVADEDWIEFGLARGWTPLCKDGRIRSTPVERRPLEVHGAVLFYLDNQQLVVDEMVTRFHAAYFHICEEVRRGGPALFAVSVNGIRKTWPIELRLRVSE